MNQIQIYTVQTMKWAALAGVYSIILIAGLFASSWLLFQFVLFLGSTLP
jgi:hypothetical protein